MKKKDLKKLALLGITGGVMLTCQGVANANENFTSSGSVLAAKCGNKGSCGGATAYNDRGGSCASSSGGSWGGSSCSAQPGFRGSSCSAQPGYRGSSCSASPSYSVSSCSAQPGFRGSSCSSGGPSRGGSCSASPSFRGGSCGASGYISSRDQPTSSNPYQNPTDGQTQWESNYQKGRNQLNQSTQWANVDNATMTQEDFKAQLSAQGKTDFDKLSDEGKANAIQMASHDCAGKNACKGQNSCKSDKNACAGQGGCKGQSTCKMTPDKAVKAASLKDKRTSLTGSSKSKYR